jgi:molybdate transport system regulatory protein
MVDQLSASLTFRRGDARVGLERAALLEAVAELGSISAAARRLGLSYKGAWDAVQALNNLFETPLIAAAPGGRSGGAASLTPEGEAVVAAFGRVRDEVNAALAKLESHVAGEPVGDLFWSLGLRTSARNALRGRVTEIRKGPVSAEVALDVGGGLTISASLTRRSAQDLGLALGRPAIALIKASFVDLATDTPAPRAGRNQLPGLILRREDGGADAEVALGIGAGKTLIVTLARQRADALGLTPGAFVTALIEASQVIVAVE